MLNYSLDVYYSETLLYIYTKTITVMIGVNFLSLLIMVYVIIRHGKSLGVYRWLLLISFLLSYMLDVLLSLEHIVPLLPATIIYFDGLIGRYFGSKFLLSVLFSVVAIKLLMLCVILLYRYAMTFPGKFQDFMSKNKNL